MIPLLGLLLFSIKILHNTPRLLVLEVNPRLCHFQVYHHRYKSPGNSVVVDTNYFSGNLPIGRFGCNSIEQEHISVGRRPSLTINGGIVLFTEEKKKEQTIITGGPWLLHKGKLTSRKEKYSPEVYSVTRHVGVGINRYGNIVLAYIEYGDLETLAYFLRDSGAIEAINLDGGNSACLRWKKYKRGRSYPYTTLLITPNIDG